jgi:hypothetical protein
MPILAANSSGYQSIPNQEEDVTPIDRNISKRAEKSNKYKIALLCVVVLAVIAVAFRWQYQERPEVLLYESSMGSPVMRQLFAADLGLAKINFGNIQCDQNTVGYACANAASPSASIEIQSSRKFQKILGFGGAFTEASAVNFYKLPSAAQEKVLQMYFGSDGIGYTLGRIHINSCDFSLESYDFDSVAGDYELKHFDTNVTHDELSILPFIRAAMKTSALPIKLIASPWSPPAWMKNPGSDGTQSMTGSATPNGLKDDPRTQLAWARYISKFVTAYASKGVPIWSVTPQNEPEFAAPWEACAYTAEFENDFIQKYLGPVLRDEHPDVLILGFDHNKDHLQAWTEVLMGNAEETYTNGMAFHCKYLFCLCVTCNSTVMLTFCTAMMHIIRRRVQRRRPRGGRYVRLRRRQRLAPPRTRCGAAGLGGMQLPRRGSGELAARRAPRPRHHVRSAELRAGLDRLESSRRPRGRAEPPEELLRCGAGGEPRLHGRHRAA